MQPEGNAVATAVRFIKLINRDSQLAKEWIEMGASEGFLSLREHIDNVRQRLTAMSCDHVHNANKLMAVSLKDRIHTELEEIQGKTDKLIDRGYIQDRIDPAQLCVSPSDFGFYNAVRSPDGVRFIDFEFAGWDDPAKTVVDFILQPRVSVISRRSPLSIAWRPEQLHSIKSCCKHLGPIVRLKWTCTILSVLNRERLNQLTTIAPEESQNTLIQVRLERASNYLSRMRDLNW